jgi:hypothetical protein
LNEIWQTASHNGRPVQTAIFATPQFPQKRAICVVVVIHNQKAAVSFHADDVEKNWGIINDIKERLLLCDRQPDKLSKTAKRHERKRRS